MIALSLTVLIVLVSDQALKLLLRQTMRFEAVPRGPRARLPMSGGRLWLQRVAGPLGAGLMWSLWVAAALALVIVITSIEVSPVFGGLILGGSLSNAVDVSLRGSVSDYVCLRFWPAFNLADVAIAGGAISILAEAFSVVRGVAW